MKQFIFLFILLTLLTSCTSIFYQPTRYLYSSPKEYGIDFENIYFKSQDGTKLHSWYLKSKKNNKKKGLILFFHGNAQNLSSHFTNLAWITKHGYDLMIFDYRGYGISEGVAEKKGIFEDTVAAINKAHDLYNKSGYKKFIIYGQSLGGALAIKAFSEISFQKSISLLVLDSTFSSYPQVASQTLRRWWITYLFSPIAYLLISNKYGVADIIPKIKVPTLVIHGKNDQVVSFQNGQDIFNRLQIKNKFFWSINGGRHIDVFSNKDNTHPKKFIALIDKLTKNAD